MVETDKKRFSKALTDWYNTHGRSLPWRESRNPYKIWLAEIMLQQTTVTAVIPYYERFLNTFPTLKSLASADQQEVLHLWQGLGYYSRARNLHACAIDLVENHNGAFPQTEEELLNLKGIGPYTAAAIATQAFNSRANVVDGNVERVVSRYFQVEEMLPKAKKTLRGHAETLLPQTGDFHTYANAIMELGAKVCTPKSPSCATCPVSFGCKAFAAGKAEDYPKKQKKKKPPQKSATVYLIYDADGKLYLNKRPETGLLGGLWQPYHEGWEEQTAPLTCLNDNRHLGFVKHVFTHFTLTLDVRRVQLEDIQKDWFKKDNLPPLPTLFTKALALDI